MVSLEYAKALYSSLTSIKEKEEMLLDLTEFYNGFNDETLKFFNHPAISKEDKKEMISKILKESLLRNFIYVLLDNDRFSLLKEITGDFNNLLLEEKEKCKVIVYSSEVLDKSYLDKIEKQMIKKLERDVILENVIDKSIKAGIRITYDSKEIDLTLNSKLDALLNFVKE